MTKYLFLLLCIFASTLQCVPPKNYRCTSKEECEDLTNTCECYCSRKCGFRDREIDDKPVYVENDPNGKFCYCKQWDLDNYDARACQLNDPENRQMQTQVQYNKMPMQK